MKKFLNTFKSKSKGKKLESKEKSRSSPDVRTKQHTAPAHDFIEDEDDVEFEPKRFLEKFASAGTSSKSQTGTAEAKMETSPPLSYDGDSDSEEDEPKHSDQEGIDGNLNRLSSETVGLKHGKWLMEKVLPGNVKPLLLPTSDSSPDWSDEYEDEIPKVTFPVAQPESETPKFNKTIPREVPPLENMDKEGQDHDSDGSQGDIVGLKSRNIGSDWSSDEGVHNVEEKGEIANDDQNRIDNVAETEAEHKEQKNKKIKATEGRVSSESDWDGDEFVRSPSPVITRKYSWDLDPSERNLAGILPASGTFETNSQGLTLHEEKDDQITSQLLQMFDTGSDLPVFTVEQNVVRERPSTPFFESPSKKQEEEIIASDESPSEIQVETEDFMNSNPSPNFDFGSSAPASLETSKLIYNEDAFSSGRLFLNLEKTRAKSATPSTKYKDLIATVPHEESVEHWRSLISTRVEIETVNPTIESVEIPLELEPNFHVTQDAYDLSFDEIGHEEMPLYRQDSGEELDRIRSSQIFGFVESVPKLSIENELTTLFQAPCPHRSRSSSLASLSINTPAVSTVIDAISSERIKFDSSMSRQTLPSILEMPTTQSSFRAPIPLSSLLLGDVDSHASLFSFESKTMLKKGTSRRFSTPNLFNTERKFSPTMPEIPPTISTPIMSQELEQEQDLLSDGFIVRVLEQTEDMIERKIPSQVTTAENSESETEEDQLHQDGTADNQVANIGDEFLEEAQPNLVPNLSLDGNDFYSRSRSSRAEKPCCGDNFPATQPCGGAVSPCAAPCVRVVKKNTYQSGSVPRYCDVLTAGVEGNPQMIQDLIRDLQCVIEKTCGSSKDIEAKYQSLLAQLAKLKEELCFAMSCRAELEKEICRLQGELQAAQFAFEEEAQRRMCLEQIVSQLRGKLGRMETLAEIQAKENQQLAACLKEMQAKIDKLTDLLAALQAERDELLQNCRGFEEWKTRQNDSSAFSQGRLAQLEAALEKCCRANEELQNEICRLKEELECLKALVEQLQCEKKRMAEEFARERDSWAKERCRLEQLKNEMKKSLDCLTENNNTICRTNTEVVSAHHVEMDCLRKEAEKYKMLYECEKEQRAKLERALKDCEERKKELLQQTQQQLQAVQHQQQQQQQQPCSPARLNPCSDILERLNSDRGEYTNDLKSRLGSANEKIAGLEKDLQHVQARNHEKDSALDRSTRDVDQCKSMQKSLEVQLDKTRDEVNQTRTMCEALRATNTQLQIQLSQNENERVKPHEAEKLARLQDENRNLLHTVEEERAAKELFRRELKDSQRLWETEVKAKGMLADRITRQERMQIQNESNNNEESSATAVVKLRETLRLLKTEVRMERDQVTKLKAKIEEQREQLRSARDTLQEVSNDSKSRKLTIELDQLKHEHHNFVTSVNRDREVSRAEISRLEQAKAELERELKDVQKELRENELNREAIQEVMRRKDRLDTEVEQLKRTINERYVERTEVAEWHANYETRIASLRTQYEAAVQAQVKAKLLEMQLALDRQARDRALIDKMRDSNEDVVRHEQSQMSVTLRADIEKLKHTVRSREEEISSLKSSILHLKKKYSSEANMKDELLKKLQIMSAVSRTSLPTIVSNNNI